MENLNFNYKSMRSTKARFFAKYGKIAGFFANVFAGLLAVFGGFALVAGIPFGWVILAFSAWPFMVHLWIERDLKNLRANKNGRNLDDFLEGDILGVLPPNPSPSNIASSVMKVNGGRFFFARFGISAQYLPELASKNTADSQIIFAKMLQIQSGLREKSDVVSAATLTAALIIYEPKIRETLSSIRIDENDILNGAEWFAHLSHLIEKHDEPQKTGGIGRDWSFGYIPTLEHFGVNLSEKYSHGRSLSTKLEAHEDIISRMFDLLAGGGRSNVALIGQVGVGKETVVEAFAEKLMDASSKIPENLRFNQVFQLDASALISAASGRGQIENLVNALINEVYRAKNIILFLNHAELFFADETGSVDVSNILQPIIEGGAIRVILAMDEQKYLQIAQTKPALAAGLNRLQIDPTDMSDTLRILQDRIISLEFAKKITFTYQSLVDSYRLSERYSNDVSQPLKSVQLLENAAGFAKNGLITSQSVVESIEQTIGVKVGGTLTQNDSEEREKLLNLEKLIHERMIDQVPAVNAVSAAIRRARAGVRNENRPIGTFLFLGPTGVGKTELAKSLAAVYFDDESKLISIDLNEYVQASDVQRLIADGSTNPTSLTAQVMKNPFSVILLDEIEKAHPNVLTALLQVLDEGIMLDINNKQVSFRDAILIATSNAGADRIRQYIEAGYKVEQFAKTIQDELINSHQFAPEFLNRFDDIVVFRPLSEQDLLQVVALILKSVNKNLAPQKVAVLVDEDAQRMLVSAGYDPRLGARPMRRIVQRTVENIVSEMLLNGQLQSGQSLRITSEMIRNSGGLESAPNLPEPPSVPQIPPIS